MFIGIGSQNRTKVAACRLAFQQLQQKFPQAFDEDPIFSTFSTNTTVPDMPLTLAEIQQGALERALFVFNQQSKRGIALGMEGGVFRLDRGQQSLLQNWVYAYDGQKGFYGCSAAIPLPVTIEKALYDQNRELAEVIDELSGLSDVRSNDGAFGILTRNLISRTAAFEMAVISAMTPFLNFEYYMH